MTWFIVFDGLVLAELRGFHQARQWCFEQGLAETHERSFQRMQAGWYRWMPSRKNTIVPDPSVQLLSAALIPQVLHRTLESCRTEVQMREQQPVSPRTIPRWPGSII